MIGFIKKVSGYIVPFGSKDIVGEFSEKCSRVLELFSNRNPEDLYELENLIEQLHSNLIEDLTNDDIPFFTYIHENKFLKSLLSTVEKDTPVLFQQLTIRFFLPFLAQELASQFSSEHVRNAISKLVRCFHFYASRPKKMSNTLLNRFGLSFFLPQPI